MKIFHLILLYMVFSLTCLHCAGQTEKELKSKKIKIITSSEETIIATHVLLGDSALKYVVDEAAADTLAYKDIVYIYIKEGSNFPKVMMYCISFGLGYGVIWGLFGTGGFIGNVAIGLGAGVIAGLIVAPFMVKPDKLIYYKGNWTDSKYKPSQR